MRIPRESLKRWFEEIGDYPPFIFGESSQRDLPDGSEKAEMRAMEAIAVMAWLLSADGKIAKIGDRPNAKEIGERVLAVAQKAFGNDGRGYKAFAKKISAALPLLQLSIG